MVTIGAASAIRPGSASSGCSGFAQHPALEDLLVVRHLELRHEDGGGLLRVVPVRRPARPRPLLHALHRRRGLGVARRRRAARSDADRPDQAPRLQLLMISTAAAQLDSPWGGMRARALAQPSVTRTGRGHRSPRRPALARMVAARRRRPRRHGSRRRCNPAPWITAEDLRRQRGAVPDTAFAQFHACRWGVGEGSWLPARRVAGVRRRARLHGRRGRSGSASTSAANAPPPPSSWVNAAPARRRRHLPRRQRRPGSRRPRPRARPPVQRPRARLRPLAVRPGRAGTRARRAQSSSRSRSTTRE